MDLLILGGTVFLGRALVDAARQRGHHVTLFNRGVSDADAFADVGAFAHVEQIHGDRALNLDRLAGRHWDAVVDTCAYVPRLAHLAARTLAGQVGTYCFVSTLSVYAHFDRSQIDESSELGRLADESIEEVTAETYGPLKALCEQVVERAMPGRTLVTRPGLIVGPYDKSDRFTYWPWRVARGGKVLAPGKPERRVQFIDVRDLAEWTLLALERGLTGIYNTNGPANMCSMQALLDACRQESGSDSAFVWAEDEFLNAEGVGAWMEMPLWLPETDPDSKGFFAVDCRKAQAEGLRSRPIQETVRAVLDWLPQRGDRAWRAGLAAEKERALLDKLGV